MDQTDQSLSIRDLASADSARAAQGEPEQAARSAPEQEGASGEPAPFDREADSAEEAPVDREAGTAEAAPVDREAGRPGSDDGADGEGPLLSTELSADLQGRWERIQTRFVDEPRGSVEEADELVANVMQKLAEEFATERERLESQWDRGEDISTEDLRVTLRRYRSFFQRLLST